MDYRNCAAYRWQMLIMQCRTMDYLNSCAACSWQKRISAMKAARRAYAKALHLAPGQGSLWGDVSASLYHEAQLRRAHPKLEPHQAHPLRASAEALMRGQCFPCNPMPVLLPVVFYPVASSPRPFGCAVISSASLTVLLAVASCCCLVPSLLRSSLLFGCALHPRLLAAPLVSPTNL